MKRTGIMGGSFDPPHNAHIAMARAALDRIPLDSVLFMPAPHPPHKAASDMSPYTMRTRMVELAIADEPGMELSRLEEFRGGPSYTADLLTYYRQSHNEELYLILGADSVSDLASWKDPERILRLSTIVVFPRTGYASVVPVKGEASVVLFEDPVIDISSTEIRRRIGSGEPVKQQIPERVRQFVLDNSFYT